MASTINANNTTGLVSTADTSGILQLQTNGTTAVTVDDSQRVAFVAGTAALPAITTTGDTNTGIFFPAADTIAFAEGGVEAARFDSAGNLGLGITNPTKKLSITGSSNDPNSGAIQTTNSNAGTANQVGLWASNGTQSAQFSLAGTGYTAYGAYAAGNAIIYNDQAITLMADNATTGIIKFAAGGNTERARIDSSGNLLVGATSSVGKVTIKGGNGNQLYLDNAGQQYTQITYFNNGTAKAFNWWDDTNSRFVIQSGGGGGVYLAASGTSWASVSDERFKDIIEPIENATQKLSGWRTVIGKYKTDEEGTRRSFLIAQDVLLTFPEAVDTTNADEYGVRYQDTIPVLVAAIQEQQAIIESLKARLDAANL